METNSIQLKSLLMAVLSVSILEIIAASLGPPAAYSLAITGVLRAMDILVLLFISYSFEKSISNIGIDPGGFSAGFKKGCIWSVSFGLFVLISGAVLFSFGINPLILIRTPLPESVWDLFLFFLVGGIIGPVAEEIFFRGFIFRYFRRLGFWFALLFSTLIFAFLHPLSSSIPISQLVGGFLFATAFEVERNLMVPISLHVFGNLAIFSISLLTT